MTGKRLRGQFLLVIVLAVGLAHVNLTPAGGQSNVPDGVFVRESTGTLWLVLDGQRVAVPVWQASDADISTLPESGAWAVMNDAHAIVPGDRPAWLAQQGRPVLSAPMPSPVIVSPVVTAQANVGDFSGSWIKHGFSLGIEPDGSAEAEWRVYTWCGPRVVKPCDEMRGNLIIPGGRARFTFDGVIASALTGRVVESSDREAFRVGERIRIELRQFGTAELIRGDAESGRTLCGSKFSDAPEWFRNTFPCGA